MVGSCCCLINKVWQFPFANAELALFVDVFQLSTISSMYWGRDITFFHLPPLGFVLLRLETMVCCSGNSINAFLEQDLTEDFLDAAMEWPFLFFSLEESYSGSGGPDDNDIGLACVISISSTWLCCTQKFCLATAHLQNEQKRNFMPASWHAEKEKKDDIHV